MHCPVARAQLLTVRLSVVLLQYRDEIRGDAAAPVAPPPPSEVRMRRSSASSDATAAFPRLAATVVPHRRHPMPFVRSDPCLAGAYG